jgi:hypothetical protein
MISFKKDSEGTREKVDFPVKVAVDNVTLRKIDINSKILGLEFNFQRVDGEKIAFFTDSLLPPNKEWITEEKTIGDETLSIDDLYQLELKAYLGYIRHILTAAGINKDILDSVEGETVEDVLKNLVSKVNKKLPRFRGKGVAQIMEAGTPNFVYSDYELRLMSEVEKEGVEEEVSSKEAATVTAKKTGTDF